MFASIERSWTLVKAAGRIARQDKELMILPVLSGLACIAVVATFLLPLFGIGLFERMGRGGSVEGFFYAWLFVLYIALYFVVIFFNCALVGAAMIRLDGGVPTVKDGLAIAGSRVGTIFGYAVVSATIGIILNMLEERLGVIGRIVVSLIGAAWSVATFLVVPILVTRDVGPIAAVRESTALLRRSWGENLVGNAAVGLVFALIGVAIGLLGFGVAFALFSGGAVLLAFLVGGLTALGLVALGIIQAALTGIFSAALYRYATTGEAPAAFGDEALRGAFRRKA